MKHLKPESLAVHAGTYFDENTQGTNSPVFPSSSFGYLDTNERPYPRYFNTVNQKVVADKIATLENTEDGIIFASGMAAVTTTLYAFLKKGDHVVFQKGLYGGTFNWVVKDLNKFGIDYSIISDNNIKSFEKAIRPETKLIYIETPSNPLLGITDMEAVAAICHQNGLLSVIDNTFASLVNQNPIDFGIDLVVHSATKYLNGHSDMCAGAVVGTKYLIDKIRPTALNLGGSLNAQMCHLLERSIKTIYVRVERQNTNAQQIAEYLDKHPKIEKVYYPGLANSENFNLAKKQMKGFGGMVSFELSGIDSVEFQKRLKLIKPSMSLGGVDTIICSPVLTSHRHLNKEERAKDGIKDGLLRLSVGIEHVDDLIADLEQALN
ncbi:MAG: aminotransferase class I/II-fold pyridoxal phosphate-dependent enzyme [Prolixibacteraceae bacterium]|nr:aminotransferase class I/II-fold pyridoxal phosphate-dependent enzyme [Prolixibacteraceae bacterium]